MGAQEKLQTQQESFARDKKTHVDLEAKEVELRTTIKNLETEEEKEKFHLALNKIHASRIDTETKLFELQEMREKALAQFDTVRQTEEGIEKKEEGVEGLIHVAKSLAEERSLSEQRYALENERHEIESSRWKIEDEITKLGGSAVEKEELLNDLKHKEAEILERLALLESNEQKP